MPGARYRQLADVAADQYGFITPDDARGLGIDPAQLRVLTGRGQLEHPATGVYRMPLIPATRLDPYMEATLWPRGVRGVLGHETALDLYDMSDVNPARIHLVVPRAHRIRRREVPLQYEIHHEDLAEDEITLFEGIPIVTAAKAVRQCHAEGLRPDLVRQAIEDGQRQGWLRRREAIALRREIGRNARRVGTLD